MSELTRTIIENNYQIKQRMKVGDWKVLFGKHKDKTFNEVLALDDGKEYLEWCYLNKLFDNEQYKHNTLIKSFLENIILN